ncbi:MAG: phosphatase PAP2 family protein [Candidatus Micrarchaeota archaeon]
MVDEFIYLISSVLSTDYYPILILLTFIALAFSRNRRSLIIALLVIVLALPALKTFYAESRPCTALSSPFCTEFEFQSEKYGFPSGHAATAIILPAATLGTYALFFFLPAAFLIAFSRVYLDMHTLNQIAAGVALGLLVFFIAKLIHEYLQMGRAASLRKQASKKPASSETGRQLIHILGGFLAIGMLLFLGNTPADRLYNTEMIILCGMVSGIWIMNMKMVGMNIGAFEHFLRKFERVGEEFDGRGALLYVIGVLLLISFTFPRDPNFALAALAIFATGDCFSTIIGRKYGANKLAWNTRKSWQGMSGFFITSSIVSYPFIGIAGIFYSAALAIVETLDLHIDDNLLIPMCTVVLFQIFG